MYACGDGLGWIAENIIILGKTIADAGEEKNYEDKCFIRTHNVWRKFIQITDCLVKGDG